MTSYEFEVAAKNAVIKALKEKDILVTIEDLQLVWFCHLVGNKKALIWGKEMGSLYFEVTYSAAQEMMYVDMYEKVSHGELALSECDIDVH